LSAEETEVLEDVFWATTVLPAMKPASAAPIISDFIDFVIVVLLLELIWVLVEWLIPHLARTIERVSRRFGFPPTEENLLPEAIFSGAPLR